MLHTISSGYGWTHSEIIEEIERQGLTWVVPAVHHIVEERVSERRWLLNIAPAYHTPMSKKSGRAIRSTIRKLHRALDRMVPWRRQDKIDKLKRKTMGADAKESAQRALKQSEALAEQIGL